jgi:hypothetical protein
MICSEESSDGREALPPLRGGCNVALSHAKTLTVIAETRVGVRIAPSTLRSLRRSSDNSNGYCCSSGFFGGGGGGVERGRGLIGKMHCLIVCFPARRNFCQLGPYGVMLLVEYVASGVDFRRACRYDTPHCQRVLYTPPLLILLTSGRRSPFGVQAKLEEAAPPTCVVKMDDCIHHPLVR